MNALKIMIAIALSSTFLLTVIAVPVSASEGSLSSGTCDVYNDAEFLVGYWYQQSAKGCTLYFTECIYKDVTGAVPQPIFQADVYLTPEYDGDHVIEDTEKCCVIKFYDPYSAGSSSVFTRFSPDTTVHYGDPHTIVYGIGASAEFTYPPDTFSIGSSISITYETTYWDTTVATKKMTGSEYLVEADIDDKKDEARHFCAGTKVNRNAQGYQMTTLKVEGHFEATGIWGTNTQISKIKSLYAYF